MTTPVNSHGLTREKLLEIDYFLRLTRTLEERLVALFRQARVIGGLYRSLGQEGESVATAYALDYTLGDVVQPLIRNMGSILVAGAKPADIIKQYMAKGDSPARGGELNIHFGHYLDAPIKREAALDVPTPYSPPLEAAALPDKAGLLAAARELLRY